MQNQKLYLTNTTNGQCLPKTSLKLEFCYQKLLQLKFQIVLFSIDELKICIFPFSLLIKIHFIDNETNIFLKLSVIYNFIHFKINLLWSESTSLNRILVMNA